MTCPLCTVVGVCITVQCDARLDASTVNCDETL